MKVPLRFTLSAITHPFALVFFHRRMLTHRRLPRRTRVTRSFSSSRRTNTFVCTHCQSMAIHSEVWVSWATAEESKVRSWIPLECFSSPSATTANRSSCGTSILGNKELLTHKGESFSHLSATFLRPQAIVRAS